MNLVLAAVAVFRSHRSLVVFQVAVLAIAAPVAARAVSPAHQAAVSAADSLFGLGEWDAAAREYVVILRDHPDDIESAYRLGSCYHTTGDYENAIRMFGETAGDRENRRYSLYNQACGYSLSGDVDNAFRVIHDAVDAGFENTNLVLRDSDLDALRDDARFADVLTRMLGQGYTGFQESDPTAEQMRDGIRILVDTIARRHPNPYRHFSPEEWARRAAAATARTDTLSAVGYYVEVRELAGMVGDVHTSAFPRRGSPILKHSYGLRFWRFQDGLYVRAATPDLAHLVGAKVLALQGVPVQSAWETVMEKMSTENSWMSTYMAQVHIQFPAYLRALGLGASDTSGQWTFLTADGERVTLTLEASETSGYLGVLGTSIGLDAPDGWVQARDSLDELPMWLKQRDTHYWWEKIEGTDAAFLQFNIPRNHGRPWREFLAETFAAIETRDDIQRLVIDVRHNEGGWGYMAQALAQAVVATPKINQPGHLYVLTSRITQSAGVTIATRLDIETQAVFVGEPVGAHPNFYNGRLGNHPPLALPGTDIVFRVSTVQEQNSDPLDDRCFIAPDIPAPMTYADYSAGRDPALEAAVAIPFEDGALLLTDWGGRTLPVYFQWKRPTQSAAFLDH